MAHRGMLDTNYARPESSDEIARIAEVLLVRGHCIDVLPTPLERLFEISRIEELTLPAPEERSFFAQLQRDTQAAIRTWMQKIRGVADLRQRVVYIAPDHSRPRRHFVRGHELGHQVLPWHRVKGGYVDDNSTLKPQVKILFEAEASLFSSEIIFQGRHFVPRARDYRASFSSIFHLSGMHGASNHATFWRFVEEQDEPVAGLAFYPSDMWDPHAQRPIFHLWKIVSSTPFKRRFGAMAFDYRLPPDHPWLEGLTQGGVAEGTMAISCDGSSSIFLWESWWNNYALLVMLRKRPVLHFVGQALASDKN